MDMVEYCIISIGTLSRNRLWGESAAIRTAHATTTLVRSGKRMILVDPSLPTDALGARFNERTGRTLADVTDVFCTTLRPVHRRSIEAMPAARWWAGAQELETYRNHLEGISDSAERLSGEDAESVKDDLKLLERIQPAPDKFSEQISLYPLPGASPGSAGLLLSPPATTIVIAGDAAATCEHVQRGQVWDHCADIETAMESLREIIEIADIIVPGHDNLMIAPRQWL